MGRSLEVRRKSENLPVAGCTFIRDPIPAYRDRNPRVLASWNASAALRPDANCAVVGFELNEKNRRCSRENGGFFIGVSKINETIAKTKRKQGLFSTPPNKFVLLCEAALRCEAREGATVFH